MNKSKIDVSKAALNDTTAPAPEAEKTTKRSTSTTSKKTTSGTKKTAAKKKTTKKALGSSPLETVTTETTCSLFRDTVQETEPAADPAADPAGIQENATQIQTEVDLFAGLFTVPAYHPVQILPAPHIDWAAWDAA